MAVPGKEKLPESGLCLEEGIEHRTRLKTPQKCETNHYSPHPQVLTHQHHYKEVPASLCLSWAPRSKQWILCQPYLCLEHLILALCSGLRNFQPRRAVRGLSDPFDSSTEPSPALQRGQERLNVPQTKGEHNQTQAEQQQTGKLLKQIGASPCFVTQTGKDPATNSNFSH